MDVVVGRVALVLAIDDVAEAYETVRRWALHYAESTRFVPIPNAKLALAARSN